MKKLLIVLLMLSLIAGFAVATGTQEKKELTVGAKNFTEQYVSGNLIALLLEENGFEIKKQFGTGSAITRDGLLTGQTDLYAEYTGTAWQVYLKHEEIVNSPVDLYNKVKAEDEANGIIWLDRWPLNDTYALAVKKDSVSKFGTSISSLGKYITKNPEKVLVGLDSEFYERPDGFFGMASVYGFELEKKYVKTMDLGLGYEALNRDQVNVAMVFSTDGLLKKFDLQVLEDDKNFFPVYNLAVTVRKEILEMYPEIEEILRPLAVMDDVTMQNLNYQVDAEGLPAEVVAKKYLQEKGLIK
ncbi:MAG: glycine/betaine ABC transporter substrate-binding protein [Spirochaetales bacterium]|nr:glycine/betaine ABC transporter substrate-binding protein [Spirochaetales bacterium]